MVSPLFCLASSPSQPVSFLWPLLPPPNTHHHIHAQRLTLEGLGLDPCWKMALEEIKENPLKSRAERIPRGAGTAGRLSWHWAICYELKDEASLRTVHPTISLHWVPETPILIEKYHNFQIRNEDFMSERLSEK